MYFKYNFFFFTFKETKETSPIPCINILWIKLCGKNKFETNEIKVNKNNP